MRKLTKLIQGFLANPPDARFEDVRYVLEAFGFQEKRSRGSHHTFENETGEVIVIPKKGGQKVKRFYVQRIVELLKLEDWQSE
jgi:predicted RNA binding protein YcfA (HicA-like mRNA interferase family)